MATSYVTIDWTASIDDHERPRFPPYSPLWRRFHYPETQVSLLLYQDGRVIPVISLDDEADDADDVILGGYAFITPDDSWQAQVLTGAGYPLVPYLDTPPPGVPR